MKSNTNIFGQRICTREECPAFHDDGDGGICNAKLASLGRVTLVGETVKYGMVCKLPIGFKLAKEDEA